MQKWQLVLVASLYAFSLHFFLAAPLAQAQTTVFSPILNISDNSAITAVGPQIAVDGSSVYAAWVDYSGNRDVFFARSIDGGSSFGTPLNVSNSPSDSDDGWRRVRMATSGSSVYLVWYEAGDNEIFFARSTDSGATFSAPANLSNSAYSYPLGRSLMPQVAVSGNNVYVAWIESVPHAVWPSEFQVFFRRSTDNGTTFSAAISLGSFVGNVPKLAASGANVYLAWQGGAGSVSDIFFARSTDSGASFGTPINVSNYAGDSIRPQLATSGGNVYIAWYNVTGGPEDIWLVRSGNGGASFDSPQNLSNNSGASRFTNEDPASAIGVFGSSVYVVWLDDTDTASQYDWDVFLAASSDGGVSFSPVFNVSTNLVSLVAQPRVAVEGSDVFVTWSRGTSADILFRQSQDGGATFGSFTNLSANPSGSAFSQVVASGGKVYVAWEDFISNGEILFRVGAPDSAPSANDQAVTTDEDTSKAIVLTGSDPEGQPLTFSITGNPAHGTLSAVVPIDATSASITYTPNADYNGADSFQFKVNDGSTDSLDGTVSVTVNPINDPPLADAGPDQALNGGVTVMLDGSGSFDPDVGDTLSYSWAQIGAPSVTLSDPTLSNPTFTAPISLTEVVLEFQLTVTDNGTLSDTDSVRVTVSAAYAGGGQRADVNAFLVYGQPTQSRTQLPAGTSAFELSILYGATTATASFSAVLNGVDISSVFNPSPDTMETVSISGLQAGRNTLVLKLDGLRSDGRTATDRDRLVFIVE